MRRLGDRFYNTKGELCQIIAIAIDDQDGKERVVYQKLSGNYEARIESYEPEEKQPEVKQPEVKQPEVKPVEEKEPEAPAQAVESVEVREVFEGEVNPALLAFLEADEIDEKLEVLYSIKDTSDEKLLTAIEASLDIAYSEGTPEERVAFIRRNLMTKAKYEGSRLRN